ncbi:hypothetical protein FEM48_Zijuj09G0118500 [Ziziphus jujuba var. spinosa]|uniref:Uncharacterized protein n=1 Tax=Ziziphus jujuba var. spinosa TaxID=714518 RepID=A0A978USU8_ZIZJJ|nr:hypothetical protein FEM48_Zijuj09G0118500 [Ziziphus jujuba var. spinosa]
MEMEVVVPVPNHPMDFNFDSTCSSPYMTAPSSPQRFGNFFFSAPTSPTRATAFYNELNNLALTQNDFNPRYSSSSSSSSIPFKWEDKPGVPKCTTKPSNSIHDHPQARHANCNNNDDNQDFEFNFSGQLDITSLSADELFDGGKIKPLKPPPRLHVGCGGGGGNGTTTDYDSSSSLTSPRSPNRSPRSRISQGKRMVQEALSPRHQRKDFDPFSAAIEETRRKCCQTNREQENDNEAEKRGRPGRSTTGFVRKGTRSLSPLRVSDIVLDGEDSSSSSMEKTISQAEKPSTPSSSSSAYSSILSAISFSKGYRKWRLKDFLLFRSASEGRATSKDPLRKYAVLSKKSIVTDDVKNSSFRSTESVGSVSSRRRGPVSAHEMHYTVNRAVSEEMRKKTVLPYKHGLLGCLGFNHGVQEISRSFGSLTRG